MLKWMRRHSSITLGLVLFVFVILLITMAVVACLGMVAYRLGLFPVGSMEEHAGGLWPLRVVGPLVLLLLISAFIGTAVAWLFSRSTLRPMRRLIAATREVAAGNFEVRVDLGHVVEMRELAASFNTMAQELANTETLRRDFVNDFSHEFKTPIVSIRGFAKLLQQEDTSDAERVEYAGIIVQESERLVNLSKNILDLSRLENLEIVSERGPFSLDEQIRQTIALMEPRWSAGDINIEVDLEPLELVSNEDMVQQVWVNLLDNAIKFTPSGGIIDLSLQRQGDEAVFRIADDGSGMDAAQLAHIFDRFYQGDTSHAGSGNGLGLSICQRIIELCGGSLAVESAPQKGATFTVRLPLAPAEPA